MNVSVSFFQQKDALKVWFEKGLLSLFTLLFLFSIYTLANEGYWLRFIGEINVGLKPMATATERKGDVIKRTQIDTLWLPVQLQKLIYDGDIVSTFSDSSVEISISATSKLFVEPDSMIRLRTFDGKPLIRLSLGAVKATFTEDQVILIKKGSEIEEVLMRKGTYFIKNDQSAGIQITPYENEIKNSGPKEESRTKAHMSDEAVVDEAQSHAAMKAADESIKRGEVVYDLPSPAEGTQFLVKDANHNLKNILISAQEYCRDRCMLRVYKNSKVLKSQEFSKGQVAYYKLSAQDLSPGFYEWSFESENSSFKSNFEIKKFSDEEFEKSLLLEKPIEFL